MDTMIVLKKPKLPNSRGNVCAVIPVFNAIIGVPRQPVSTVSAEFRDRWGLAFRS